MLSALENLCGANKPLKAEPPHAQEFAALVRVAKSRLKDAGTAGLRWKAASTWHTTRRTDCVSRRCAGTGIDRIIGTSSFKYCRTLWDSTRLSGVSSRSATMFATSVSTRAVWTSTSVSSAIWSRLVVAWLRGFARCRRSAAEEVTGRPDSGRTATEHAIGQRRLASSGGLRHTPSVPRCRSS